MKAKIISTHGDSGFASACQNKQQIKVVRWDSEPTPEQLAQYPNSEWSKENSGDVVFDNYKGRYDEKPVRTTSIQMSTADKWIMAIALVFGVPACLFFALAWIGGMI